MLGAVSVGLNTLADVAVAYAASRLRQASGGTMMALGLGRAMASRPSERVMTEGGQADWYHFPHTARRSCP